MGSLILKVSCSKSNFKKVLITQQISTCSKKIIETLEKDINMFKVDNKDTMTSSCCAFIVNFEHISHISLVFLLMTLSK